MPGKQILLVRAPSLFIRYEPNQSSAEGV
jgi:hypothetical protein